MMMNITSHQVDRMSLGQRRLDCTRTREPAEARTGNPGYHGW